jgi:hypothetical protein
MRRPPVCDHARVNRLGRATVLATVIACALATPSGALAKAGTRPDSDPVSQAPGTLLISVGATPGSTPMPPGFLGVSMEFSAVHQYTGSDPSAINPVLVQLLRNLAPGQTPVLRIGGDSADWTWWPTPGALPPDGIRYALTPGWMASTRALVQALGAKLILGLNLAAGSSAFAATEARALVQGLGTQNIAAFEPGNEPDLYGSLPWYYTARGRPIYSRPRTFTIAQFTSEFSAWRALVPGLPIVGPSFANLPWMAGLGTFLTAEPGLAMVTFHRYPLRGCNVQPTSPSYATISNLLSDYASTDLAHGVAPYVTLAHQAGLKFRLDEMNSVACSGKRTVSDTFASALWMLDTLFEMTAAGVDGVNIHTLPNSIYELFSFTHGQSGWNAIVHPDYYGMLMFERADPVGARLLPVSGSGGQIKVWATVAPDGTRRVLLINKDPYSAHNVLLTMPAGSLTATLQTFSAPSAGATSDVTIGGQSFGSAAAAATDTGTLAGHSQSTQVLTPAGIYGTTLPPASAQLLTQ